MIRTVKLESAEFGRLFPRMKPRVVDSRKQETVATDETQDC